MAILIRKFFLLKFSLKTDVSNFIHFKGKMAHLLFFLKEALKSETLKKTNIFMLNVFFLYF